MLGAREATEKLVVLVGCSSVSKGVPQVGRIVSVADAVGFYKFSLGKLKHIKC